MEDNTSAEQSATPVDAHITVREKVAQKIDGSGDFIQETVVNKLADVEVQRRIGVVEKAVNHISNLEKDLSKINKPDIREFTSITDPPVEKYSETRINEVKKKSKALKDLVTAFNNTLSTNTAKAYVELEKLLNNKGDGGASSESKE